MGVGTTRAVIVEITTVVACSGVTPSARASVLIDRDSILGSRGCGSGSVVEVVVVVSGTVLVVVVVVLVDVVEVVEAVLEDMEIESSEKTMTIAAAAAT